MTDPFAHLISEARIFLAELSANNSKDWFGDQKSRYDVQLKTPALLFLDQIAAQSGRDLGCALTPKLFRAHRDVRFSKDKTPYHTHLHMLWTLGRDQRQPPALFFGISPDYVTAGGGVMGFDKPGLVNWRSALDGPPGEEMEQALAAAQDQGFTMDEPELKRVPAPYAKDHARGDLLRRKGLAVWRRLTPDQYETPLTAVSATFRDLKPVLDQLGQML